MLRRGERRLGSVGSSASQAAAVAEGVEYGSNSDGRVTARDIATGEERWTSPVQGGAGHAIAAGTLFVQGADRLSVLERGGGAIRSSVQLEGGGGQSLPRWWRARRSPTAG